MGVVGTVGIKGGEGGVEFERAGMDGGEEG